MNFEDEFSPRVLNKQNTWSFTGVEYVYSETKVWGQTLARILWWTILNYGVYVVLSVVFCWLVKYLGGRVYFKVSDYWRSTIIWCFKSLPFPDLRQDFKESPVMDMSKISHVNTHSHPLAAGHRGLGNAMINNFIISQGFTPYSLSMSNTEQEAGMAGERLYYHAKDMVMDQKCDIFRHEKHVMKMTDVDYYVDMNKYLDGRMLILYTFVPTKVCGVIPNARYTIDGNSVSVHINGGGQYKHEIWDYESDHFVVDHWWGSVVYLLETRSVDANYRIIWFNPISICYGPIGWFLPGRRLVRRVYSQGSVIVNRYREGEAEMISLKHVAGDIGVELPIEQYGTIINKLGATKEPHMSDVERILRSMDHPSALVVAAELFVCYKLGLPKLPASITPAIYSSSRYQTLTPLVFEDGHQSLRELKWFNYLPGGYSPDKSYNNDYACIKYRVQEPKFDQPLNQVAPSYLQWADDFVRELVPDDVAQTFVPLDYEGVLVKMNKPKQVRLIQQVAHVLYEDCMWLIKAFQKREAYGKITAPRNISTLPIEHNARLAQFVYSFANHLKSQHWYAFGRAPFELAQLVHEKVSKSRFVTVADGSKYDGTVGALPDYVYKCVLKRAFSLDYRKELDRSLQRETGANGVTKEGIKYLTGTDTKSGSACTTQRNSVMNAFTNYCAFRKLGHTSSEAYRKLGFYGGDDGITCDLDLDTLLHVSATIGFAFKSYVVRPLQPLPFLGRIFVDPWTLSASIADVPRQLSKLHLTRTVEAIPDYMVLRRKAEGLLVTDRNTPVLADWARAVIRIVPQTSYGRFETLLAEDDSYWLKYTDPFPALPTRDLTLPIVAEALQVDVGEVIEFCSKLDRVSSMKGLDVGQFHADVKVEIPVESGGDVLHPNVKVKTVPELRQNNLQKKPKSIRTVKKESTKQERFDHQDNKKKVRPNNKPLIFRPREPLKPSEPPAPLHMCRFIEKGKACPYGNTCKFSHKIPVTPKTP